MGNDAKKQQVMHLVLMGIPVVGIAEMLRLHRSSVQEIIHSYWMSSYE